MWMLLHLVKCLCTSCPQAILLYFISSSFREDDIEDLDDEEGMEFEEDPIFISMAMRGGIQSWRQAGRLSIFCLHILQGGKICLSPTASKPAQVQQPL